jgi:hypothetical protein
MTFPKFLCVQADLAEIDWTSDLVLFYRIARVPGVGEFGVFVVFRV